MADAAASTDDELLHDHAIIAGFGVPGRAVAERLARRGVPICVIEMNPAVVVRLANVATPVIPGDVTDESVLRQAGIERAVLFVVAVPDDNAALGAVREVRRLNPSVHILARCHYISTAMEATRRGANAVVCEEQAVATEFTRLLDRLPLGRAPDEG